MGVYKFMKMWMVLTEILEVESTGDRHLRSTPPILSKEEKISKISFNLKNMFTPYKLRCTLRVSFALYLNWLKYVRFL